MIPSPQQTAIFSALSEPDLGLFISAGAGCGKTTTILECLTRIPSPLTKRIAFLAFNKDIVETLRERAPFWAKDSITTFHSLCLSTIKLNRRPAPKVDPKKLRWLIKDHFPKLSFSEADELIEEVENAKNTLTLPENDAALRLFNLSIEDTARIDFTDMLHAFATQPFPFAPFDLVFIDEAQDTNTVQRAVLKKLLGEKGRLIAVGDPYQSIYGFRGADSDAVPRLVEEFSLQTLPLSVTYRCGKRIVEEARAALLNPAFKLK